MLLNPSMKLDDVVATAADRPVYIWGARHDGLGMLKALQRSAVEPAGFIDNNPLLQGKTVMGKSISKPRDVIPTRGEATKPFIFIASGYFADEIADECETFGLVPESDYVAATDLQYFNYQIDHAGFCNLRCISCAVANFASHHPGGFMPVDVFEKVIKKIVREDPFVGMLRLYDWGEPLLNPAFADILEVTNQHSMLSVLSSNLNVVRNLDNVVKAKPTWFRVSNSGFGENYELTHTGGRWEVFYKNLLKLADARAKYHPEMEVELFFHIYKHNRDDFPKMQALCDELGFILRYTHAYVFPLDHVESIIEGRPVNDKVKQTCDLLHLKVEDAVELAKQERERPCYFERFIRITWDLKMTQCINWYDPGLLLCETDFLSTPFQKIVALKRDMELCKRCKANALHRYCNVYGDNKLIHKIESVKVA